MRTTTGVVTGLILTAIAAGHVAAAETNPNIEREFTGKIAFTDDLSKEYRGEEYWRLTVHPDGSRTIRMTNPITATKILRDVVLRVDKDYVPLHAHITHWEGGQHRGAGFYWREGTRFNAVVSAPNGTLQQSVEVPAKFSIGSRPQAPFAWHAAHYDRAKGGVQTSTAYVMDRVGTSVGSILGRVIPVDVELLGEPRLTVGAGTFDTYHFRIEKDLELWVDKKEFFTVLLISRETERPLRYELVELKTARLGE